MTLFKIIQNNLIVSVGCTFLKWNPRRHKMNVCDVNDAQFVQTYDEQGIYKTAWLKSAPEEAGEYDTATVVIIDEKEYNDLKKLLEKEEPIIHEKPDVEEELPPEDEPVEEVPMTIGEMRKIILEQQKQIESLMEKVK